MAKKSDVDFSDMSEADRVRLVAQTALIAQESGGVEVMNGRYGGRLGVMIWIAGYLIEDGEMNEVEAGQ